LRIQIMETFGVCLCKSLVPTYIHFPSLTDLHTPPYKALDRIYYGQDPTVSPFFSFSFLFYLILLGLLTTKV
jgi:hypothetical protein